MSSSEASTVVIRPKRQITLPSSICDQLGVKPGDTLELVVDGAVLKAVPRKTLALDALREIQDTFKRSGITGEELQKEARRTRQEIARGRSASKG